MVRARIDVCLQNHTSSLRFWVRVRLCLPGQSDWGLSQSHTVREGCSADQISCFSPSVHKAHRSTGSCSPLFHCLIPLQSDLFCYPTTWKYDNRIYGWATTGSYFIILPFPLGHLKMFGKVFSGWIWCETQYRSSCIFFFCYYDEDVLLFSRGIWLCRKGSQSSTCRKLRLEENQHICFTRAQPMDFSLVCH